MEQLGLILMLLAFFGALVFHQSLRDALVEALENFRGGPPTPRHPLPADDGVILRRRRSRVTVHGVKRK
jgi:hypothetical protein